MNHLSKFFLAVLLLAVTAGCAVADECRDSEDFSSTTKNMLLWCEIDLPEYDVWVEFDAPCCYRVHVYEKDGKGRYVYDAGGFLPSFKDVDGDGHHEMIAGDPTYSSWPYGRVSTPAPDIIWRMTPSGFSLAVDLMSKPLPAGSALESYKSSIGSPSKEYHHLYFVTLDLIYSGHEREAWAFFDEAWPMFFDLMSSHGQWSEESAEASRTPTEEEAYRKEEFRGEFVEKICSSLFADSLDSSE